MFQSLCNRSSPHLTRHFQPQSTNDEHPDKRLQNVDDVEDGDQGLVGPPWFPVASGLENLDDKDGKGADAE